MPAFGIYSTTDEWLLLRGFTGSGWQRAKVRAIQPVQQTGQRQPSVFDPQFFSRGLFTTNPQGLRGAAGLVSNAVPPLWRPESLATLWRRIKELDTALSLKSLVLVWFWFLTVEYCKESWWVTVSLYGEVRFCKDFCYHHLPWLDAQITSELSWDSHQISLFEAITHFMLFFPDFGDPKSPSTLFK